LPKALTLTRTVIRKKLVESFAPNLNVTGNYDNRVEDLCQNYGATEFVVNNKAQLGPNSLFDGKTTGSYSVNDPEFR
jgi:hypothetical protein